MSEPKVISGTKAALFFLVLGVLVLAFSYAYRASQISFIENSVTVTGTVTREKTNFSRDSASSGRYRVYYEFMHDGKLIEDYDEVRLSDQFDLSAGDTVEVRYDPANVERSALVISIHNRVPWPLWLLGFVLTLLGCYALFVQLKNHRQGHGP